MSEKTPKNQHLKKAGKGFISEMEEPTYKHLEILCHYIKERCYNFNGIHLYYINYLSETII